MSASEAPANDTKSQENMTCDSDALPRRFERYTLLKRLARGGMGEVLLASSGGIEGAERPVVVKIIRKEHETDRSAGRPGPSQVHRWPRGHAGGGISW